MDSVPACGIAHCRLRQEVSWHVIFAVKAQFAYRCRTLHFEPKHQRVLPEEVEAKGAGLRNRGKFGIRRCYLALITTKFSEARSSTADDSEHGRFSVRAQKADLFEHKQYRFDFCQGQTDSLRNITGLDLKETDAVSLGLKEASDQHRGGTGDPQIVSAPVIKDQRGGRDLLHISSFFRRGREDRESVALFSKARIHPHAESENPNVLRN